ncbi:MAG: hypothetical protein ACO3D4_09645 [Vulcanococcus sp.]
MKPALNQLLAFLMAAWLPLLALLAPPAALALMDPPAEQFLCEGETLVAALHNGAVDAPGIPNSEAGTVPGAFLVVEWRGMSLQLPRTNNAGAPSYTDGRWWWQAQDPDHPEFAQRTGWKGDIERYQCQAQR